MVTSLAVLAGLGVLAARSTNMNGDYAIGNPNPNATKRWGGEPDLSSILNLALGNEDAGGWGGGTEPGSGAILRQRP